MMIDTRHFTNQQRATFYKEHVQKWRDSGLNKTSYCREHGLRVDNLRYWDEKFQEQEVVEQNPESRLRIVPIKPSQSPRSEHSSKIDIQLGDCVIGLRGPVDEADLSTILKVLRGCKCGA